ncbi:hypothetical protein HDU98_006284 [Podochytrium sp. JEL0797]|nr:hypothetical protein HDU98_006284 [Podochytrium sp. JEL0797]
MPVPLPVVTTCPLKPRPSCDSAVQATEIIIESPSTPNAPHTSLPSLPIELVEKICSLLPTPQILRLRQLSHSFHTLLSTRHFAKLNLQVYPPETATLLFYAPPSYQSAYISTTTTTKTTFTWSNRSSLPTPIPPLLAALTHLTSLDLSHCGLTGCIPESLTRLTNLQVLDLSRNRLSGQLPSSIGAWQDLRVLNAHSNALCGDLPEGVWSLHALEYLNLGYNQFTGEVSSAISKLNAVREVYLCGNRFVSKVPMEVAGLTELRWLFVRNEGVVVGDEVVSALKSGGGLIGTDLWVVSVHGFDPNGGGGYDGF